MTCWQTFLSRAKIPKNNCFFDALPNAHRRSIEIKSVIIPHASQTSVGMKLSGDQKKAWRFYASNPAFCAKIANKYSAVRQSSVQRDLKASHVLTI